ncbi:eCIS core domain-containing protein [Actinokineospora iranica]|uniref:eCIS core domain-containing protein n=1 Tax=Actinokineospora iranica TaxID=1271860 RepID=A0A1G6XAP7_9PSEU|nr:DUF4157 domain-containing protein [Actinokineospora iranica]SDD75208.1 protein of unknown function [Actinokineospora iranica]
MRDHDHDHDHDHPTPARPASATPKPDEPAGIAALQRTAGNEATSRLLAPANEPATTVPDVLKSPGAPLPPALRTDMESRLGHNFSSVRLHTDTAAARSATEINARAYTSGEHVVIGPNGGDRHTLAHELTHVIQQRQGKVPGEDHGDGLRISDPSDNFERAAEATATEALRHDPTS